MANKWIVGALAVAATVSAQEQVTISREMNTTSAYQAVLTQLKKDGLDVNLNFSQDAGIETALTESGGIWKTGCFYKFTFIPNGNKTTVRIVAYTKKRVKGAAGWTAAKEDIDRSRAEAFQLQRELNW
ncbi:MAG TPA: hypothetical protein VK604_14955 [Bryobacteraceae bacterium]|nr:hypothetical protein [Bryobacteraceae bacterium]